MIDESANILLLFYNRLKNNILREEKSLRNNSILWTLMQIQSKKTEKLLNSSAYYFDDFSEQHLSELKALGYITSTINLNNIAYILTAKGIWEIEKQTLSFSEENLINFIQDKYLKFSAQQKPLDDNEKLALFSLLCIRNFSNTIPMDLNTLQNRESWKMIFKEVFNFLNNLQFFKLKHISFDVFIEKSGSEHPIQMIMRHLNNLPIKSGHIFCFGRNSKYFLDIVENNEIQKFRLKQAFKMVFPTIPDFNTASLISNFCISIANDYAKYVVKDFRFIDSTHDEVIERIVNDIYID